MLTIPHYALHDNDPQKKYTVYALVEPVEPVSLVTWKNVRYIGLSNNVLARYSQHLACRAADSNEDKNEWVTSVLVAGKMPQLHEIEKTVTIEQGRAREQYWIRYAIAQGAALLNRAITYTEQERLQAKIDSAAWNAKAGAIMQQGVFIKRSHAFYPPEMRKVLNEDSGRIRIYHVHEIYFLNEQGILCNLVESTHEDFDAFIRRYIPVLDTGNPHWDWDDRICAVNFARCFGRQPEFCEPPPRPIKPRRKKGK